MSERIRIGDEYWFQPPHNGLMGMVIDEDLDTIAYFDKLEEAQVWLNGYIYGLKRGERVGAEQVRSALRDVLGVRE